MLYYRTLCPYIRFCRSRNGSFIVTLLLVLVLLGLFFLTLISFNSRAGSLSKSEQIPHSSESTTEPNYTILSQDEPNKPKQRVLLVGYMRSGSTLCGDILQAHPKVFYVYEPLLYLWDHYIPGKKPYEKDITKRVKKEFQRFLHHVPSPEEFLDHMFTCNLTTYNVRLLTNVRHSRDFKRKECKSDKNRFYGVEEKRIKTCGNLIRDVCHQAHTVVQKTVRMSMEDVEPFLQRDPHLKVIHLLRDPRGAYLSRHHFTNKSSGEMHKNLTCLCTRLENDLKMAQTLASKYWGRILTVRYEDLTQNPEAISAMMYRFTGLEFLPSMKAYLRLITNTERLNADGHPQKKSTARKNPFSTAYHWRKELSWNIVQEADMKCEEVYRIMGYVPFQSEVTLKDLSIPAKLDEFGENLMTLW